MGFLVSRLSLALGATALGANWSWRALNVLVFFIWLFPEIGGLFCGCLYNKSPGVWGLCQGPGLSETSIWSLPNGSMKLPVICLGLEMVPMSLLLGLCMYYMGV